MKDIDKLKAAGLAPTLGDLLDNPRVKEGDNQPPPDPFDVIKGEIEDLYLEARNWLDGDPIETPEQAEALGKLRDLIRDADKRAEELRKVEAKPFDDGKAEVQARYNPLIQKERGLCAVALQTINKAIAPYLKKLDDEQRERARLAQEDAKRIAEEARLAAQAAAQSGSLADREKADTLIDEAKSMAKIGVQLEKEKPQIAGTKRAIGMKTVYYADLVDPAAAIAHYRVAQPGLLKQWLIEQAATDVRSGPKPPAPIPGFTIREEKVPA